MHVADGHRDRDGGGPATVAVATTTATAASAHVDDYPPFPWSVDNVVLIAPQVDFGDGNGLDLFGQPLWSER